MRVHDFLGRPAALHPNTLVNIVDTMQRRTDSYLSWALSTDVELYEATHRPGDEQLKRKPKPPELFEYPVVVQVLSAIYSLLQQQVHYTATIPRPKKPPKPKVDPFPAPVTAVTVVRRKRALRAYETVQSMIVHSDTPPDGASWYFPTRATVPGEPAGVVEELANQLPEEDPDPTE